MIPFHIFARNSVFTPLSQRWKRCATQNQIPSLRLREGQARKKREGWGIRYDGRVKSGGQECPPHTGKSDVAFLLPNLPVGADGLEHGFGGVVQPLPFLLVEVAEDRFARGGSAEMDVGSFPSHGVKQA
jgi:hypothetical protein